jgi:hypothetical protein
MRYWFSELLQKKQRSPHSRVLKVRHWAAEGKIHSEYTMMLHRPHPLQGQHPVIYHPVEARTLSQMELPPYLLKHVSFRTGETGLALQSRIDRARELGLLKT